MSRIRRIAPAYAKAFFHVAQTENLLEELAICLKMLSLSAHSISFRTYVRQLRFQEEHFENQLSNFLFDSFFQDNQPKDSSKTLIKSILIQIIRSGLLAPYGATLLKNAYIRLLEEHLGKWHLSLKTAYPMGQKQIDALIQKCQSNLSREIILEEVLIDPNLIGGFEFSHPTGWSVQASIQNSLNQFLQKKDAS